MKNQKDENVEELEKSIIHTRQVVVELPMNYEAIGMERFARTQAFLRAYQVYEGARDEMLESETIL